MFLSAFMQIPILRCLAAMIVGILLGEYFCDELFWIAIGVLAIGIASVIVYSQNPKRSHIPTLILVVGFVLFGGSYARLFSTEMVEETGYCTATGYVSEIIRDEPGNFRFGFCADSLHFKSVCLTNSKGVMSLQGEEPICDGQRLKVKCKVRLPSPSEFNFDYYNYLKNNHFEFLAQANQTELLPDTVKNLECYLSRIRLTAVEKLRRSGISETNANLLQALVLGDRSRLPRDVQSAFSNCGIIHLLAVSGLHVGIIFAIVQFICQKARLRRRAKCLTMLAALWFYAVLCGLSPSIFRATIMMSFCTIGECFGKQQNVYNSMALALFIILLFDPMSLYSIGLWLSFCSVLALVTFFSTLKQALTFKHAPMRKIYELMLVSFIAQMATMPISMLTFNTFPTYFLINNLIVVPLAAPIVAGALATLALGSIPILGNAIAIATDSVISFVVWYAKTAMQWPHALITKIPFTRVQFVLLVAFLVVLGATFFCPTATKRRVLVGILFAFGLYSISISWISKNTTRISAFVANGRLGLAVTDAGESRFYLSDTTHTASLKAAEEIARQRRTPSPTIFQLKSGMKFHVDDFVLSISQPTINAEKSMTLMLNGDVPPDSIGSNVIVAKCNAWNRVWDVRQREQNADLLWIDEGKIVDIYER